MYVDVLLNPQGPFIKDGASATVVVIDVLRATSTIITALSNGCEEVIATAGIEESLTIASSYGPQDYILGGEQRGEKVEGFNFGNSPSEYAREYVEGKRLILSTTNGTKAIKDYGVSKEVILGCFLNADAVVRECIKQEMDVLLVCSGQDGHFAMEDAFFSGLVAKALKDENNAELNDAARAAVAIYDSMNGDIEGTLKSTDHGKYLISKGFEKDVEECSKLSTLDIVAKVSDRRVVRKVN